MKYKNKKKTKPLKKARTSSSASIPAMLKGILYQRLKEVGFLGGAAFALFLILSLFTYQSSDPGWTHAGSNVKVYNSAGPVGAYIADLLFYLFGYMGYLIPLAMLYVGWLLFLRQSSGQEKFPHYILLTIKLLSLWLLFLMGSTVLAMYTVAHPHHTFVAGGMIGKVISEWLTHLFNPIGTGLVLLTLILTALTFLTGLSWLFHLGRVGLKILNNLQSRKISIDMEGFFSKKQTFQQVASIPEAFQDLTRRASAKQAKHTGEYVPSPQKLYDFMEASPIENAETDERQSAKSERELSNNASKIGSNLVKLTNSEKSTKETSGLFSQPDVPDIFVLNDSTNTDLNPASQLKILSSSDNTPQIQLGQMNKTLPRKSVTVIKTSLSLDLLDEVTQNFKKGYNSKQLAQMSSLVELQLKDFNVIAHVVEVSPGPVVTRFELQLAAGTKVSKVTNLAKDLARSMSVTSVRVVEVIEGKSLIGLELPNKEREVVRLRDILASKAYEHSESPLTLALGKDIAGHCIIANLAKMPHLLVAGTTGSGKSVGVNAMLLSLLYKSSPDQLRLLLIDPKMLELSIYDGIPHLLTPVVTDMKDAARALRWCVVEMERRYKLMAKLGVRNLAAFNEKVNKAIEEKHPIIDPFWDPKAMGVETTPDTLKALPFIVVVADEFADMMMVVGKKIEELITRIAQKARAAGIHLILATQRPSVDVITGLIKANVPTRIAFQVSSKIDSRTILDQSGAEQLLGHGDMLYLAPGKGTPVRIHGAFVDDNEVHRVTAELKKQGVPEYIDEILCGEEGESGGGTFDDSGFEMENPGEKDALYDAAVKIVLQTRKASVSNIQRRLKIGYNRAARLVETMEAAGIVSNMNSNGSREVLVPAGVE